MDVDDILLCVLVSFLVPGDCFCVSGFIGCDYLCCVFGFVCSGCCFRFLGLVILVISGFCSHCNINCASYSYFFFSSVLSVSICFLPPYFYPIGFRFAS